jgi:methionyl-tRNA synthetase
MLNKIDGVIGTLPEEGEALVKEAQQKSELIAQHYENRDFSKAIVEIRTIADAANRYFDEKEPWVMIKTDREATRDVLSTILNLFRLIAIYLKPILPEYVRKVEVLLGEQEFTWASAGNTLEDHKINEFEHLAKRIDKADVEKILEASKQTLEQTHSDSGTSDTSEGEAPMTDREPISDMIEFDDFAKIDLRVAEVVEAEEIEDSKKLIRLKVNIGSETREIIAGIKLAYKPEDLVGKQIIVVVNLKPRKMKFGISEGMLLTAGDDDRELFLLTPDSGAKPGQKIH